ncbi:MAG: hypothetical protein AAGJ46_17585 [Planctomycetota bacterium]
MIDDEEEFDYYGEGADADGDEYEGLTTDPFFGESGADDGDEDGDTEDYEPADPELGDPTVGAGVAALLAALLGGDAAPAASESDRDQLAWRETYFVLFEHDRRPTLTQVEHALTEVGSRMTIENLEADDDGLFQSLLVQSPQDNAAIEISYESGDAVMEQSAELAKMLEERIEGDQLAQLMRANARLDVMHFEQVHDQPGLEPDEPDTLQTEALDPAALITVVEALSHLTGGLPVDPAAGELLD